MGAKPSKTESSGDHKWKASGPPSVSLDVIEKLQSSPETDASRSRQTESHLQARVAAELKKQELREAEALRRAHQELAAAEAQSRDVENPTVEDDGTLSRSSVAGEIDALRRKLEDRKRVRDLAESMDKARLAVLYCLREHDRRPLDCWKEVEAFKTEVRKMEKEWVNRVSV